MNYVSRCTTNLSFSKEIGENFAVYHHLLQNFTTITSGHNCKTSQTSIIRRNKL